MTLSNTLALIRPENWIKNILVFAALVFSGQFTAPVSIGHSVLVFVGFCSLASAGYVLNDWIDRERDRNHPEKSNRPIASGAVSGPQATGVALVCLLITSSTVWALPVEASVDVAVVFGAYGVMMVGYDFGLKHLFGVELIIVAVGFVLRAVAGGVGIQVPLTGWFLLTIFFLCLMIVSGKRRHELSTLAEDSARHRPVLGQYDVRLFDALIVISASTATVTYSLWTVNEVSGGTHSVGWFTASIVFVVFGLMRYFHLLYSGKAGSPERMFTRDWPMILCVLSWSAYMSVLMVL